MHINVILLTKTLYKQNALLVNKIVVELARVRIMVGNDWNKLTAPGFFCSGAVNHD